MPLHLGVVGCTAVQVASDKLAEKALGAIGLSMPENPNQPRPTKTVTLKIDAANNLNAAEDGQGMATVLRLYKLRDKNAFQMTPYSVFGNPDKEKNTLGNELVDVRELIVSPGQAFDLQEKITSDTNYLGVVTLFRTPARNRWRFAFASNEAIKNGITLGLHGCAMTAPGTTPINLSAEESALLSPARCK